MVEGKKWDEAVLSRRSHMSSRIMDDKAKLAGGKTTVSQKFLVSREKCFNGERMHSLGYSQT